MEWMDSPDLQKQNPNMNDYVSELNRNKAYEDVPMECKLSLGSQEEDKFMQ